ncbi:hypothetical protein [Natronomonas gomsonensis]|uniref:hypothetical protein n=1 Tax=Natronomonas gomsonensis TaxID=1046043 RepID=UPI0015B87212|nr:hypothetical protein [Natronomonas gomsonensis]
MEGIDSGDGEVSATSADDNLLDGDPWAEGDEMEPADSDSEGEEYEFVGPEADENWPDTGVDGGDGADLGEVVVSGAESALLANPATMPAALAWDAATAATVDDSPVNVVDDAVGTGADAGSEAFIEWQFGDLDGDGQDLGGGSGGGGGSDDGGDGDGWLPGWAPYAAAGIVALVVLIVLTPYARLGAEVAG